MASMPADFAAGTVPRYGASGEGGDGSSGGGGASCGRARGPRALCTQAIRTPTTTASIAASSAVRALSCSEPGAGGASMRPRYRAGRGGGKSRGVLPLDHADDVSASAVEAAHDGADRDVELVGGLAVGQAGDVDEHHDVPERLGQRPDRLVDLAGADDVVGAGSDGLVVGL